MVIENELKKLVNQLRHDEVAQIRLGNSDITVKVFDHGSQLSLTTSIYYGGNFIPKSVRRCIAGKSPFDSGWVTTNITVDEQNFQIYLNYQEKMNDLSNLKFKDLLEEFSWQADEWRLYLDEHDKNDLVHVHVK